MCCKVHLCHYPQQLLYNIIIDSRTNPLGDSRIGTVLTGILVISMIYGLAFGLGRLSRRRWGGCSNLREKYVGLVHDSTIRIYPCKNRVSLLNCILEINSS
jgi:hypothetical protein